MSAGKDRPMTKPYKPPLSSHFPQPIKAAANLGRAARMMREAYRLLDKGETASDRQHAAFYLSLSRVYLHLTVYAILPRLLWPPSYRPKKVATA